MSLPNKLGTPRWRKRQSTSVKANPLPAAVKPVFTKSYFFLGLILLVAFAIQEIYQWNWALLTKLQMDDVYKQLSGFALIVYLAHQWHCSVLRTRGLMREAAGILNRHKLLGAMAPLFFYAHSQHIGFAYLQVLSLVFFGIFLTGIFNYEISRINKPWFRPVWITIHVGLSTGFLFLLSYHIYISYSYQ
ncbi:MAG: hypothetical protein ACXWTS_00145 [Methylococcaceae bacterium]